MSTDLALRRRKGGPALAPKRVAAALDEISRGGEPKVWLDGGAIRFAVDLPREDKECAAIPISLAKNGARLAASARGHAAALTYWCLHALAPKLEAEIDDPQADEQTGPVNLAALRAKAAEVVRAHEREVLEDRRELDDVFDEDEDEDELEDEEEDEPDEDEPLAAFFTWLVEKKELLLAGGVSDIADLGALADKPEDLYEALLDHEEVEDVFLSEAEFVDRLRTFRALRRA